MRKNLAVFFLVLAFVVAGAVVASTAKADVTYNYVGNPYTTVQEPSLGGNMTMSVTFDSSVVPSNFTGLVGTILSWSVTSGSVTYASLVATGGDSFSFQNGQLTGWYFEAGSASPPVTPYFFESVSSSEGTFDLIIDNTSDNYNSNDNAPGTWTEQAASVPLPATFLFLGPGLLGLAGIRRRFKK